MKAATSDKQKLAKAELIARFVEVEFLEQAPRYVVAAGDKRTGQRGSGVATIGVKHARGYGVVVQLDSGKLDVFDPMQLLPAT
ncbi:hypothetical protein [Burkholderia sp. Ac-20365]|uniref:hypothetical protein n=1 Tax=Burkholderia sp. Ac-20365 TaxID=2703897 RepID=UPI00197B559A|nr:hypothetical protein [Burkholderia sp. Ac-20365]MBN3761294.1 hypothetical protein [Burkholderia sp. Ac-20365]